jgi:tetratricopeptide (TPR) repeat protein
MEWPSSHPLTADSFSDTVSRMLTKEELFDRAVDAVADGDLEAAVIAYRQALAIDPDYAGALAAKGQMLAELPRWLGGDRQEAARLLRRAVVLDPDDARMRLMLANVLEEMGQRDEARTHALAALDTLQRDGAADDLATARTLVASLE